MPALLPRRVKLRAIAFFPLIFAALLCAEPTPAPTLDLTSDNPIVFDDATKEMIATGNACLTYGDVRLMAGELRYNQKTGVAIARNGLVVTQGPLRLVAAEGDYEVRTGKLRMKNVRAGQHPLYVLGETLEGDTRQFTIRAARVTYGEPHPMVPAVFAESLDVRPGVDYHAKGAHLRLLGVPLMPLPRHSVQLGESPVTLSLKAGYRTSLGAYSQFMALGPVAENASAGLTLGLYSRRGILVGPAAQYNRTHETGFMKGGLRSGYISDHGDRDVDILNRPVPHDRGFIDWKHLQRSGDFSVNAQLNYWSDSETVRDFDRDNFSGVQQPDTFFEAAFSQPNWQLSFFSRAHLNEFHRFQQRLPEIRFDMPATPIGAGILERVHASYVHLRESGDLVATPIDADRLDAVYTLMRPWRAAQWLTLTPVAGGRVTHYFSTANNSGSYTRGLGELGLDARAQIHATFEYENATWKIDGLRHLVEPFVSYRWVPSADAGRAKIPQIDRRVFATRLQPLGLADVRNIDDLRGHHAMRFGVENRLQTRDARSGVRDLVTLTLAADLLFEREANNERFSDLHMDFALHPAHWISWELYQRIDVDDRTLDEVSTSVTLRDADWWMARVGLNFLRNDFETYRLETLTRLNERFALTAHLEYDADDARFTEQRYGVRQTVRNLWTIHYEVGFFDGLKRESATHFRVTVELLSF